MGGALAFILGGGPPETLESLALFRMKAAGLYRRALPPAPGAEIVLSASADGCMIAHAATDKLVILAAERARRDRAKITQDPELR